MRTPSRVLFYGDYGTGINTGFATVLKNIRPRIKKIFGSTPVDLQRMELLKKKYADKADVTIDPSNLLTDVVAMNYQGQIYTEADGTFVCSAERLADGDGYDEFGRIGLAKVLKQSTEQDELTGEYMGYDGLFILHDAGVILPYVPLYKEVQADNARDNKRNFKSIFYLPIDCEYNADSLKNIDWFDCIVTYNEFGKKQILRHRPDLRKKIRVVPHGVDTSVFYPMSAYDKLTFREQYFGRHANKFIICNVNRNQHRKDIPATIFSFIEYRHKNPDSILYLHMHPSDPMGWDIPALLLSTNLRVGRDVIFPPSHMVAIDGKEYEDYQCDDATLNKIYNACDVYFTSTRGEGWGLTQHEAMSCGLPVICPYNTSLMELSGHGERAYLLESQFPIASRADNIIRYQIDPEEGAEKLALVQSHITTGNPDLLKKIEMAQQYAWSLNWDVIAEKWVEIFKEIY